MWGQTHRRTHRPDHSEKQTNMFRFTATQLLRRVPRTVVPTSIRSFALQSSTSVRPLSTSARLLSSTVSSTSVSPALRLASHASYRFPSLGDSLRSYSDAAPIEIQVPPMGDSISEGTLETWEKQEGDFAAMDDLVCTIETDKVAQEIRAPQAGTISAHHAGEGDTVAVGAKLFTLIPGEASADQAAAASAPKPAAPASSASTAAPAAASTPAAQPAPAAAPKAAPAAAPPAAAAAAQPSHTPGSREERRVPMNRMRKRIAERLKESQNTYASLTTFNEIDMSGIMSLRQKYKDDFQKKHGVKLGFMSAFLKASATALMEIPAVNGVIDGEDIVYRDYADISVAVATPKGLVVPVVRNCESLDYAGIEKEIGRLGGLARDNKLAMEDMAGGTFTVSNGGVFGSMMGTPIINPQQSAILGMHKTQDRAVVVDGQIVIRPMMYVALTYDHRLIDGREAVTFLVRVKELVEDPARLILG
mmetsp:Transcript_23931/g.59878  ORF Transcript_23931/g.59878 Transcript_23931/m.59878 type:complete len:476 (-) Transcript_23931:1834-3261(-)